VPLFALIFDCSFDLSRQKKTFYHLFFVGTKGVVIIENFDGSRAKNETLKTFLSLSFVIPLL